MKVGIWWNSSIVIPINRKQKDPFEFCGSRLILCYTVVSFQYILTRN
jgi:hypothetical protein